MPTSYKSLCFTIRPKGGVPTNTDLEQQIIKYLKKHKGFVCAEFEDDHDAAAESQASGRHLHGQAFWETDRGKTPAEFKVILLNYTEKSLKRSLSPDEKIHAFKIKVAYSDEFYATYCQKEDGMLYTNMPNDTATYYPSQQEQDRAIARSRAVDKKYFHLEEKYLAKNNNILPKSLKDISSFIYESMFVTRTMHVIEDPKKRNQLIKCLYEYILKDNSRYIVFLHPEEQKKADILNKYKKYLEG